MNYLLKNKFKFLIFILSISSITYFTGCSQLNKALDVDSAQNGQGKIQFGYSNGIKIASKGFSTFATSTVTPSAVIVTIESVTGNIVQNQTRLELIKVNNEYMTSPIALAVGTYQLTQFMVVDKNNNTLYLAPLKESPRATLVDHPLPITITVEKDKTNSVIPDVLPLTPTDNAQAFGYPSFKFNVVNPIEIFIGVQGKNNAYVSANLVIKNDGVTLNSYVLKVGMNRIEIKSRPIPSDGIMPISYYYDFIITKSGYLDYEKRYEEMELINGYEETPLLISLTPSTGKKWSLATNILPWKKIRHTATVFNDKLWIIGGDDGGYAGIQNSPTTKLWFSENGINWTEVSNSIGWGYRMSHTSCVFNNKLWILGGWGAEWYHDVWYTEDGINWNQATNAAAWSARQSHACVVFNNKIWILGGLGTTYLNDIWNSADGINWTQVTHSAPWSGRGGHTCFVFNNKIWIMGGKGTDYLNDIWNSADGINWTQVTHSAPWSGRYAHSSVVYDHKIWMIGGTTNNWVELSDVWYSSDGINWVQSTNSADWPVRSDFTTAVFKDKIWMLGGNRAEFDLTDAWYTE